MAGKNEQHTRFDDLGDEPLRTLSPIKGYENLPLVSLEKAVEPISHLFISLDQYVWIAKKNCESPEDHLTTDESASIFLYTMEFQSGPSLYRVLNKTLRNEDRGGLVPWFLYLRLFFAAFDKLPSDSMRVWRGIKNVDLSSQYQIGKEMFWWGITSTTEVMNVLENETFLGKTGRRTIFSIDCRSGKKISAHSYFKDKEQEVLLLPGFYFKVKANINPSPDLHIIDLAEIKSPFSFLGIPSNLNFMKPLKKAIIGSHQLVHPNNNVTNIAPSTNPSNNQLSSIQVHSSSHPEKSSRNWKCSCPGELTCESIALIIVFTFVAFIFMSVLIVGQVNKNSCPIQSWVSQWMTVFGAVGFTTFIVLTLFLLITSLCCEYDSDRSTALYFNVCIIILLMGFYFCWLIAGTVWIYPLNTSVQFNNSTLQNYCHEGLYKYAIALLSIQYILLGIMLLGGICALCIGKCCD